MKGEELRLLRYEKIRIISSLVLGRIFSPIMRTPHNFNQKDNEYGIKTAQRRDLV